VSETVPEEPVNLNCADTVCPQTDSNRHWADFENGSVGCCDQRKQVTDEGHIACKTPYLTVASTRAVRLQYGYKSPPVAGVTPG
jgi:hypothetical protein